MHFQDLGAYGRIVHLQPMRWINHWPVIGIDKDGDNKGEPVPGYKKPSVGAMYPVQTPADTDEFNSGKLGMQWQWHANPQAWWAFPLAGNLRLFSVLAPDSAKNLWAVPNLLMQKFPAAEFTVTTKFDFKPALENETMGFLVMGYDYAYLGLTKKGNDIHLSYATCKEADKGKGEVQKKIANIDVKTIYVRLQVRKGAVCSFGYSLDGNNFTDAGETFTAQPGRWIGAKFGFFCLRAAKTNDAGFVDIDYVRVDK
jgi:beta-xylosidase